MSGPGTRRQYPCRTCGAAIYSDGTYWRAVRDDTTHCASDSIGHLPDAARAAAPPVADQVEELERTIHPEGRCQVCGGGKPYWKHNANPTEYHAFVPPASPEPTPGLREAAWELSHTFDWLTYHYPKAFTEMPRDRFRAIDKFRAALAASPAPGLDAAETLPRLWWCGFWGTPNETRFHGNAGPCDGTAFGAVTCGQVAYVRDSDLRALAARLRGDSDAG